tara:strand:- start:101 stop:748 length:648 start_codon:yes stop_codon:yes gene_type:complete
MDEAITTDKSNEAEIDVNENLQANKQNSEEVDSSIFDETLKQINQILNNLEQKSEIEKKELEKLNILPEIKSVISKIYITRNELTKEENNIIKNNNLLKRIENLEKNINNSDEPALFTHNLKKRTTHEAGEHKIDSNVLSMEELHAFKENDKTKKKNFGFYGNVILFITIFFTFYGILSVSKGFIVLKYPITEPYIQYFYEIIEIVKVTIFNLFY